MLQDKVHLTHTLLLLECKEFSRCGMDGWQSVLTQLKSTYQIQNVNLLLLISNNSDNTKYSRREYETTQIKTYPRVSC